MGLQRQKQKARARRTVSQPEERACRRDRDRPPPRPEKKQLPRLVRRPPARPTGGVVWGAPSGTQPDIANARSSIAASLKKKKRLMSDWKSMC